MTITVIHEVHWLPNDVEAKLNQIIAAQQAADTKLELVLDMVEHLGTDPEAIKLAAAKVRQSREQLQTSINKHPKGE